MPKNGSVSPLKKLQQEMIEQSIDAWIVPSSDPHLSEYLPDAWKLRERLSGFTGSAGMLLLLQKGAYLWTDSRYWVQAEEELSGSGITLMKSGALDTPTLPQFLLETLPSGAKIALLAATTPLNQYAQWRSLFLGAGFELVTDLNPFPTLFNPPLTQSLSLLYPQKRVMIDRSAKEKRALIHEAMRESGATAHLITTLDDIAWITNLRGDEIPYNPLFRSYLLFTSKGDYLFASYEQISPEIGELLEEAGFHFVEYEKLHNYLGRLDEEEIILIDSKRTTLATLNAIPEEVEIIDQTNPSTLLKSQKTSVEILHTEEAMIQDGAALARFFARFERMIEEKSPLTELDVARMLKEERQKEPHFVSLSFGTIAAFKENGALPHYHATEENHLSITDEQGLLLIDSGAHYHNGTTDITRVIPIGFIHPEARRDYTLVLKALIAMSSAQFPESIPMPMLDSIARAPLWAEGIDFGHGTGHGVGYFLNVHEGPQTLAYKASVTPDQAVKEGMITSIEPGIYREGRWGIRIENLTATRRAVTKEPHLFGEFLNFQTLTLCPIDTRPILKELLNEKEIKWLNRYHKKVADKLAPRLEGEALAWLLKRTEPL